MNNVQHSIIFYMLKHLLMSWQEWTFVIHKRQPQGCGCRAYRTGMYSRRLVHNGHPFHTPQQYDITAYIPAPTRKTAATHIASAPYAHLL